MLYKRAFRKGKEVITFLTKIAYEDYTIWLLTLVLVQKIKIHPSNTDIIRLEGICVAWMR
jgi:hypothetical protein